MPVGPGKYDDIATQVREQTNARGVLVAVIDGYKGSGFSIQSDTSLTPTALANMLQTVVDEIRKAGPQWPQ